MNLSNAAIPTAIFSKFNDITKNIADINIAVIAFPKLRGTTKAKIQEDIVIAADIPTNVVTRASLLTGQRPDYTQVWDLKTLIRDKVPNILTLPQYFRQQGYTTSGIGKVFDSRSVDKNADEASWSIPYLKLENNDFAKGFNKPFNSYYQSQELIRLIESFKEQGIKNGLKRGVPSPAA